MDILLLFLVYQEKFLCLMIVSNTALKVFLIFCILSWWRWHLNYHNQQFYYILTKKVLFNFSSVTEFSSEILEISGRYESKFLLEGDICPYIDKKKFIKLICHNIFVRNTCFDDEFIRKISLGKLSWKT